MGLTSYQVAPSRNQMCQTPRGVNGLNVARSLDIARRKVKNHRKGKGGKKDDDTAQEGRSPVLPGLPSWRIIILRWIECSLQEAGVACAWLAARRLLLPHCYATITMPYWNENEYQIRRPGNQTKGRGSDAWLSLSMSPHCLSPGKGSSRPANP